MSISDYKVLGIIPARGGSKGVPRKNIRLINGKHLIGYAIESALESHLLTDLVVSTDDAEIAAISESYGASVQMRPSLLAQDATPMIPVLQHALQTEEIAKEIRYDYVMTLQPTAPMRTAHDIDEAIKLVNQHGHRSIVSVYLVEDCHPARMYVIDPKEGLKPVMNEPDGSLRQALPDVYHRNGCIYLTARQLLLSDGRIMDEACFPFCNVRGKISQYR